MPAPYLTLSQDHQPLPHPKGHRSCRGVHGDSGREVTPTIVLTPNLLRSTASPGVFLLGRCSLGSIQVEQPDNIFFK